MIINNMNSSEIILAAILELGRTMDPYKIIQKFGDKTLSQSQFRNLVISLGRTLQSAEIDAFYDNVLKEYKAQAITIYIINELIRKASKLQACNFQSKLKQRAPHEIMSQIAKMIRKKNQDIQSTFRIFDFDKDCMLKESEFKNFVEFFVPSITSEEYIKLRQVYRSQNVCLYELMEWLQESSLLHNSIKLGVPANHTPKSPYAPPMKQVPQKDQSPVRKKSIPRSRSPFLGEPYVNEKDTQKLPPKIVAPKLAPVTPISPIQQQPVSPLNQTPRNEPATRKRSVTPKKLESPAANLMPRARDIVQESIFYEDPNRAHLLTSNIDFKDIINVNYELAGVQEFMKLYHQHIMQNKKFVDSQFPPNQQSIGPKLKYYEWKRLSDIFGSQVAIFVKDTTDSRFGLGKWISQRDIQQGELGDCYFLSTLSTLACRWPDIILGLFLTQKRNSCEIYAVRLCIDGVWKAIIIDDFVPVVGGHPAFSQSKAKDIWVLLLEKAWAKAFGSFSSIESGESREVMKSLTSGPTWTLDTNQKDFKSQFNGCVARKCLMTVGSIKDKAELMERLGLVPGHAYSILKQIQVKHPTLGEVTLVKLRNAWGKVEWQGDWSDNSKLWTPELRQQCKVKVQDDGIFFMDVNDLIKYFARVYVCYFQPNYVYDSQTFVSKKTKSLYFTFDILTEGEYYITVHQSSSRHFKNKYSNFEHSGIRILLGHFANSSITYEEAKYDQSYDSYVGGLLQKGRYYLQIKVIWQFWQEHDFTVSVYGEKHIKIKQIPKNNMTYECMLSKAKQNPSKAPLAASFPQVLTCQEINLETGFGYIYYQNDSQKTLELENNFQTFTGLKLKKPERGTYFRIVVPPLQFKLVILVLTSTAYQMRQQMSFMLK